MTERNVNRGALRAVAVDFGASLELGDAVAMRRDVDGKGVFRVSIGGIAVIVASNWIFTL